jgi:hypothetical protein
MSKLKGCITVYSATGYTEIGCFTDEFSGTCANGWEKYSWESWLVVSGIMGETCS